MDLSLYEDLSSSELVARLANRGVPVETARALVSRREHLTVQLQILGVLSR